MKRTLVTAAALVAVLAGPALAQTTYTTTTTTTERVARPPLSLEPQQRTIIREYVVQRHVPPATVSREVVVGQPLAREVELQPVPQEWGPQVQPYRYVYANDRVMLVDPATRQVVQVLDEDDD